MSLNQSGNRIEVFPVLSRFHFRLMSARFTGRLSPDAPLLLGLGGGPGLSGHYLDNFFFQASTELNITTGILDLPNHDDSIFPPELTPADYLSAVKVLASTILEISGQVKNIILLGHSFGGRIILDILAQEPKIEPSAVFSVCCPYCQDASDEYIRKTSGILVKFNTEEEFRQYWRQILPCYFCVPPSSKLLKNLTLNTSWVINSPLLLGMPSFSETITHLRNFGSQVGMGRLVFIEGGSDIRLLPNNHDLIRKDIPEAIFASIAGAGHFPMYENVSEFLVQIAKNIRN